MEDDDDVYSQFDFAPDIVAAVSEDTRPVLEQRMAVKAQLKAMIEFQMNDKNYTSIQQAQKAGEAPPAESPTRLAHGASKYRAEDFLKEFGADFAKHLGRQFVPTYLYSSDWRAAYRDADLDPVHYDFFRDNRFKFDDDFLIFYCHEWSEGSPKWIASKWSKTPAFEDDPRERLSLMHYVRREWGYENKLFSVLKRDLKKALYELWKGPRPLPGLPDHIQTIWNVSDLSENPALSPIDCKAIRILTQAMEIGAPNQYTNPLRQYRYEGVPIKESKVIEELCERIAESARALIALAEVHCYKVMRGLQDTERILPIVGTPETNRLEPDEYTAKLPAWTEPDRKDGNLEAWAAEARKEIESWKAGRDLEMDRIVSELARVPEMIRQLSDEPAPESSDGSTSKLVSGIEAITHMTRSYVNPTGEGSFSIPLLRASVDALREISKMVPEKDSHTTELVLTMVVLCLVGCSQTEDFTVWLALTDFAIRLLVKDSAEDGAPEDAMTYDELVVLTRHVVPTLYGAVDSLAVQRHNVKRAQDTKTSDDLLRSKLAFFTATYIGQICPMCGIDTCQNELPKNEGGVMGDVFLKCSCYNYESMIGAARYRGTGYSPNSSFKCLALFFEYYPHKQLTSLYSLTSITGSKGCKNLRKVCGGNQGWQGRLARDPEKYAAESEIPKFYVEG